MAKVTKKRKLSKPTDIEIELAVLRDEYRDLLLQKEQGEENLQVKIDIEASIIEDLEAEINELSNKYDAFVESSTELAEDLFHARSIIETLRNTNVDIELDNSLLIVDNNYWRDKAFQLQDKIDRVEPLLRRLTWMAATTNSRDN